jgi:hypothetical protein
MQLKYCLALKPAISPGREDRLLPHWKNSLNGEATAPMENGIPSPWGRGKGEGEGNVEPIPSPVRRTRFSPGRKRSFHHGLRIVPPHPGPLPWGEGEPSAALSGAWRARNPPVRRIRSPRPTREGRAFAAPLRLRSATARPIIQDRAGASERRREWLPPRRRDGGGSFLLLNSSG